MTPKLALEILAIIYLWCAIGDMVLAFGRWGWPEDRTAHTVLFWPTRLWWSLCYLVHDWRKDLYYRTKHQ